MSSILTFWLQSGPMLTKAKKKVVKNRKLIISKIRNSAFVRTAEKKNPKKFKMIQRLKRFKSDLREE